MRYAGIGVGAVIGLLWCAHASARPIPWRAEDGGNNHHYEAIRVGSPITWEEARVLAEQMSYRGVPGYLASIRSPQEQNFIASALGSVNSLWVGGYQQDGNFAPDEGWAWVSGEPWDWTFWAAGEPNDSGSNPDGFESRLQLSPVGDPPGWNDLWPSAAVPGFIVEFDTVIVPNENRSITEVKATY